MCQDCIDKRDAKNKIRHAEYIEKGLCKICGEKDDRGAHNHYCTKCNESALESYRKYKGGRREYYKYLNSLGNELYCLSCFRLSDNGVTVCSECQRKNNDKIKEYKKKRKEDGTCRECGQPRFQEANTCLRHFMSESAQGNIGKSNRWTELLDLFDKQDRKCYYTGKELIVGKNASVDHKLSRKRFPNKKKDINNLVWCDVDINTYKRDQTDAEFIAMCHLVARTHPQPITTPIPAPTYLSGEQ